MSVRELMLTRLRNLADCLIDEAAELWPTEIQAVEWAIIFIAGDEAAVYQRDPKRQAKIFNESEPALGAKTVAAAPMPAFRLIIEKMTGEFTMPTVLEEVRKTYPTTNRTHAYNCFNNMVRRNELEIVQRGTPGRNSNPTIYRKVNHEDLDHTRRQGDPDRESEGPPPDQHPPQAVEGA